MYSVIIGVLIFAYILGSIPFGWLLCRTRGVDIRLRGSGNIGFANVLRIMGWKLAIPTLVGDVAKGLLPVYMAWLLGADRLMLFAVGIAAIVGHIFPVWLKFRGGKGVATGLGVCICMQPLAALAGSAVYVALGFMRQRSSIASLVGIGVMLATWCFVMPNEWWMPLVLFAIALLTLRQNIFGTVPEYG